MITCSRCLSRLRFALTFVFALVAACTDTSAPTAPMLSAVQRPRLIEYSSGFYLDADGYYYWDGSPPPGDLDQAIISSASTEAQAPSYFSHGFVGGRIDFVGDESNIDLIYSVDSAGTPLYSNSQASSGWVAPGFFYYNRNSSHPQRFLRALPPRAGGKCNFSMDVGGTASARKAVPFGISLTLTKSPIIVTADTKITWGSTSVPMTASHDPGWSCDDPLPDSNCDDETTLEREYCPLPEDPNNKPNSLVGGLGGTVTNTNGAWGGSSDGITIANTSSKCVRWINWYVSFDGGQSWEWTGFECTEYAY